MKPIPMLVVLLLLGSLSQSAWAASAWFRIRAEPDRTVAGRELVKHTNTMCQAYSALRQHNLDMIQKRETASDYTPVANNWGFVDVATGQTVTESVAEAAFNELASFIGNGGPSLEQWCARVGNQ